MNGVEQLASLLDDSLELGLEGEERWFRSAVTRGIELRGEGQVPVDRAAGVIFGYSVITKGPALGHNAEIDDTTMEQVVTLGNHAKQGIKTRFDHPNASSTSMGTFLGRTKHFRRVGGRVVGDLFLNDSAKDAPQGDLYAYVMKLAESDPASFGASIVWTGQYATQRNDDGTEKKDKAGKPLPRLARLEELLASDVVDDPAANPGGLFSKVDNLASKLTQFLNRWAEHDLLPQLQAFMAATKEEETMATVGEVTNVKQLEDAARSEGHQSGIKAERERVAAIQKSFTAVWGENPPASEVKVRDGLIELGVKLEDAETDFKRRKLTQIHNSAPISAGGGGETRTEKADLSTLPLDERCKAEFEGDAKLRDEFGKLSTYVAFKRAEGNGSVRIKSSAQA